MLRNHCGFGRSERSNKGEHGLTPSAERPRARTEPVGGVLEGSVDHPPLKRSQGLGGLWLHFIGCLSARPPLSKVDLGQPCQLRSESFPPGNQPPLFGAL